MSRVTWVKIYQKYALRLLKLTWLGSLYQPDSDDPIAQVSGGMTSTSLAAMPGLAHYDQNQSRRSPYPLNSEAVGVLSKRRGTHPEWCFNYRGKRITQTSTKAWRNAIARAGIQPGFRFHDLRHTWASWHVQAGTPLHVLQELGGWSSYDMVLRYAHLGSGHLAEHAESVAQKWPHLRIVNSGNDS